MTLKSSWSHTKKKVLGMPKTFAKCTQLKEFSKWGSFIIIMFMTIDHAWRLESGPDPSLGEEVMNNIIHRRNVHTFARSR